MSGEFEQHCCEPANDNAHAGALADQDGHTHIKNHPCGGLFVLLATLREINPSPMQGLTCMAASDFYSPYQGNSEHPSVNFKRFLHSM
jgi:hypothetical protein